MPDFGRRIVIEQPRVRAREQVSARRALKRAHIICAGVPGNIFGADRVRIVTADTFVGAKPHNVFAIDESGEDMIRSQCATGFLEAKPLGQLPIDDMESTATVRRHPNVIARAARDEGHGPSRSITFRRLYWLSLIEERAFFGAS